MTMRTLAGLMTSTIAMVAAMPAAAGEPLSVDEAKAMIAKELESRPAPFVGKKAPELKVGGWVQGAPVSEFVPGETYVVEMWATWCGPCIDVIPHLNKLHKQYEADEDTKVTFIGMNISDAQPEETDEQRSERIQQFINDRNGEMTYRVAYEDGRLMGETWMQPADQRGIPAAFIVDGDGRVAWVGHPGTIDEPLESIVNGEHDIEQAKQASIGQAVLTDTLMGLQRGGDASEALKTLEALTLTVFKDDADRRAEVGFYAAQMPTTGEEGKAWSMRIIDAAVEASEGKAPIPLAYRASLKQLSGDTAGAIEDMSKALEVNEDERLGNALEAELKRMKEGDGN